MGAVLLLLAAINAAFALCGLDGTIAVGPALFNAFASGICFRGFLQEVIDV